MHHLCSYHFSAPWRQSALRPSLSRSILYSDTKLFFLMLTSACEIFLLSYFSTLSASLLSAEVPIWNSRATTIWLWTVFLKPQLCFPIAQPGGIPPPGPLPSSLSSISSEESFPFPSHSNLSWPVWLKTHLQGIVLSGSLGYRHLVSSWIQFHSWDVILGLRMNETETTSGYGKLVKDCCKRSRERPGKGQCGEKRNGNLDAITGEWLRDWSQKSGKAWSL